MPWETDDSSGFLTNFIGKVIDPYFNEDANYKEGALLAYWECQVLEILQEWEGDLPRNDDDDPTVTPSWACGTGWETDDNDTATHPKREQFHASSLYGRIIDVITGKVANYGPQASRTDGQELVCDFDGLIDVLTERGDPRDAKVWEGLIFEFAELMIDFGKDKQKGGDARMTSTRPFPIRWVSDDETKGSSKAKAKPKATTKTSKAAPKAAAKDTKGDKVAAAKAKAAAAKAKTKSSDDPFAGVVDNADLAAALLELLDSSDSFDAWLDGVVEIDGVADDNDLLQVLLDADNGPWASKG